MPPLPSKDSHWTWPRAAEFANCYQLVGHESLKSASKPVGSARPWSGSIANISRSISSVLDANDFTKLATRISRRIKKKTIREKGYRTGTIDIFESRDTN
ncbi:hypothetical protein T4E_8880 [Trichinella pseudospiralis]|uniref:Uncharacterized protein n=1 Tax=Trichinella pseudospiralis TaxID=6337 RepID=A0A0V0XEZ0_TRIPS|nr:hypothetical protein T4E_8880 [Trichinella pseudospiralis]